MTLDPQVREDDLVAAVRDLVAAPSKRIHVGIGDDAAVWQPSRSHRSVITTDASIENVHFTRALMSWQDAGARTMAANISDVAAMGAKPVLATVALGLPADVATGDVLELYRGLSDVARDARCVIVGGDITRAPGVTIAVTVVGEVRATRVKLRSGAKAGDVLAVTGPLGASRAGLQTLRGEVMLDDALREEAASAYRRPSPRWREGLWLGASSNVTAMMDCSDGLSTDLDRMCEQSGVGAVVESVPVAACAVAAAQALSLPPEEYALAGGEEYELIVAVKPRAFDYLAGRFRTRFGRALLRVGTFRRERGIVRIDGGREVTVARTGWDHLQR